MRKSNESLSAMIDWFKKFNRDHPNIDNTSSIQLIRSDRYEQKSKR